MSENTIEYTTAVSVLDSVDLTQLGNMMSNISKFQSIIQQTLKKGHDFDTIPGTQKPTLLKPGAEKTLMLLGLTSEYSIEEKVEDYQGGVFAYTVKCTITKNGNKITEGLGSCNSKEDKYRWRWVKEDDLTKGIDINILKDRTNNYGKKQYRIENDEIYSQVNTLLKMAKKRAQIDATLTVAALSEVFTQDMEDLKAFIQAEEIDNMKDGDAGFIKVTFGKHKGKTLQEIAKEDISYVQWLAKNAKEEVMKKAAAMILKGDKEPKQDKPKENKPKEDKPSEDVTLPWEKEEIVDENI